jgi:hypothetical protein
MLIEFTLEVIQLELIVALVAHLLKLILTHLILLNQPRHNHPFLLIIHHY